MRAKWLLSAALLAVSGWAQAPEDLFHRAPPPVDQSLRIRVTEFYRALFEGRLQAAEKWVALDSRNTFQDIERRNCSRFAIVKLTYNEQFTRADALITCATEVQIPSQGATKVTMPLASKWKVINGAWLWYAAAPRKSSESAEGKLQ